MKKDLPQETSSTRLTVDVSLQITPKVFPFATLVVETQTLFATLISVAQLRSPVAIRLNALASQMELTLITWLISNVLTSAPPLVWSCLIEQKHFLSLKVLVATLIAKRCGLWLMELLNFQTHKLIAQTMIPSPIHGVILALIGMIKDQKLVVCTTLMILLPLTLAVPANIPICQLGLTWKDMFSTLTMFHLC